MNETFIRADCFVAAFRGRHDAHQCRRSIDKKLQKREVSDDFLNVLYNQLLVC